MLLTEFLERLGKLDVINYVGLDDSADRLNCQFTVLLLIIFSLVTTVKTYFLTPIACYLPNSVGSHEGLGSYVTNMCYTDGLYNVPLKDFLVDNANENWKSQYSHSKIYYYQWLPFVFAVQGLAFLLPSLFWRLWGLAGGVCDLGQLARSAAEAQKSADGGDRREKVMRQVARQLEFWLRANRGSNDGATEGRFGAKRLLRSLISCLPSKSRSNQLVWLYMTTKLMYIGNLVGQLLVMAALFRTDPSAPLLKSAGAFSADLATQLATGADWRRTGLFPRSGCCVVALITSADPQFLVAQCALPVNMIHEKLFAFLWLWMPAVLAVTVGSFAVWCGRIVLVCNRKRHLARSLRLAGAAPDSDEERALLDGPFANNFLGHDGDLLLRLLARACGELAAAELCAGLFRGFVEAIGRKDAAVVIELGEVAADSQASPRRIKHSGSGGFGHHQHHQNHHYQLGGHRQHEHRQQQQATPTLDKLLTLPEPNSAAQEQ